MKKTLTTAAMVLAIVAAPLAPASAAEYGGPMRTVWCKIVPAWCNR